MNKRLLAVVAIIGLIVVGGLLYFLPAPQPPSAPAAGGQETARNLSVEIRSPNESKTYEIACEPSTCNLTPFSALQKIGEDDTIAMQFKTYEGLGTMVTALSGLKNGQDNKYWVYEVNGAKVPVAADQYALHPGDRLLWKFVIPE